MNGNYVLISLDQQIGQMRLGTRDEVLGIDLYPHTFEMLLELDKQGVRCVLIAPTGSDTFIEWPLGGQHPLLVVDRLTTVSQTTLQIKKLLPGFSKNALFISVDRNLRGEAQAEGLSPGTSLDVGQVDVRRA